VNVGRWTELNLTTHGAWNLVCKSRILYIKFIKTAIKYNNIFLHKYVVAS
jgi:hypothetical protein